MDYKDLDELITDYRKYEETNELWNEDYNFREHDPFIVYHYYINSVDKPAGEILYCYVEHYVSYGYDGQVDYEKYSLKVDKYTKGIDVHDIDKIENSQLYSITPKFDYFKRELLKTYKHKGEQLKKQLAHIEKVIEGIKCTK